MSGKAKEKSKKNDRINHEQRRARTQQVIFAAIAVIMILSMLITAAINL